MINASNMIPHFVVDDPRVYFHSSSFLVVVFSIRRVSDNAICFYSQHIHKCYRFCIFSVAGWEVLRVHQPGE